jgi:hypothetical protein
VALELGERGIDLADVSAVLGHKDIVTTRKHYAPVLSSRLKDASERLAGRFGGWNVEDNSETLTATMHCHRCGRTSLVLFRTGSLQESQQPEGLSPTDKRRELEVL